MPGSQPMQPADRKKWRCLGGCSLRGTDHRKIYEVRKTGGSTGGESELAYGAISVRVQAAARTGGYLLGSNPQQMYLAGATLAHPKGTVVGVAHLLVDPAAAEEGDLAALLCDKCRQTPVSPRGGGGRREGGEREKPSPWCCCQLPPTLLSPRCPSPAEAGSSTRPSACTGAACARAYGGGWL